MQLLPTLFVFGLFTLIYCQFDPYSYEKKSTSCSSVNRETGAVDSITLGFVEVNPKATKTLIFVHGWAGLWSTWFRQIEEFQEDYHLIIPDLRGFGLSSTVPNSFDIRQSGSFADHISDIECIMRTLNVDSAVCVGHDWGSQICYEAARSRPDLFKGVVGTPIPYLPSTTPFTPTEHLHHLSPRLAYQHYFNIHTPDAIQELNKDVRRTLRATLGSKGRWMPEEFLTKSDSYLKAWGDYEIPPIDFFTSRQEDYMVEAYEKNGFEHTLGFYMDENRHSNWQHAQDQGNHTLPVPVLIILQEADIIANLTEIMVMFKTSDYIPILQTETIDGAHWLPQTSPTYPIMNTLIRQWLIRNFHEEYHHSVPKATSASMKEFKATISSTDDGGLKPVPTITLDKEVVRTGGDAEMTRDEL